MGPKWEKEELDIFLKCTFTSLLSLQRLQEVKTKRNLKDDWGINNLGIYKDNS